MGVHYRQNNISGFFRKSHQLIFKAIQYLLENSREVDVVTLFEFLEQEGESEIGEQFNIAKQVPSKEEFF